jgi:hypothetical protein
MITLSLPNPALPREYRDCRARGWLLRGAPIVPLVPGGKRPLNGWDSRHPIRTLKALVRVLEEDATCNYGVLLSPESGLVGIDVDGEEGLASWRELDQGRSPKTLTVNTPRGFHLYFAHRGEVVRNSAGKLGVGIDVRGNAGYLVGPGSRSSSGELYRFAPGLCPGSVKIARLPDFLLDLLTGQGKIDNPTGGAAPRAHATVREGGRNTHLTSVAGHLQNTGISPDALLAALLA